MNPQNYTINIRPGWGISPVVKVSQGDVGRPLAFAIMDGQDALTIASGTTVTLKGTKPSTLGFTQACELSGNTASVETTATMTQEAGAVQAELILTQGTTVIGSANFVMYVEPAAHPEGTTDGDTETARDLMTRAEQAVEQAEAAAEQAEASAEAISQAGIDTTGATAGQVPTANGAGGWTWEDPQGAGGGTSDDIENKSSVSGTTVTGALNSLSDEIASVEGGAPTQAQTVAQMVDTSKVYLYTGSEEGYIFGAWYHYNGTDWVYGGMYGEAASMSAGVKAALLACFRNVAWIDENGQTYYENLYNELYPPANLVSITAVYTQSGIIYNTSSLDDLRTGLVVTANMSDGTSRSVTDYMLTGELTIGISTILVSYSGKETTFTVTVTDYNAVDYTINPLDGITWHDGYTYSQTTGVLTATSGEHCTEKFDGQSCVYIFQNSDTSNNRYFTIFAWDETDTYIGYSQYNASVFSLKKGYKYAIKVYNTAGFDPTTLSFLPKDNTQTATAEFSIKLADYVDSITIGAGNRAEFKVTDLMLAMGITASNLNTKINKCNISTVLTPVSTSEPFANREFTFWFYNINTLMFKVADATTLDAVKTYIANNDPTIVFNEE